MRRSYQIASVAMVMLAVSSVAVLRERVGYVYRPASVDRGVLRNVPGLELYWYGRCTEDGYRYIELLTVNTPHTKGEFIEQRETRLICGRPERF